MVRLVILSHLFLIIISLHRYLLTINTLINGIRVGVSFGSVIDSTKLFPNPRQCNVGFDFYYLFAFLHTFNVRLIPLYAANFKLFRNNLDRHIYSE